MTLAALIARLDALLPQTQCRQCGYAGCSPYAEAMASGRAGANQCPPGGDDGARSLAEELGVTYAPVDRRFGTTKPPSCAVIDESKCIGCALCIQACPVDAIVGAAKYMHTVIADKCTGCELCLPPCPVDCIAIAATGAAPDRDEQHAIAQRARLRFDARERRALRNRAAAEKEVARKAAASRKRRTVQGAIERARLRLAQRRKTR
jgi:electron transport complex protein RnfB